MAYEEDLVSLGTMKQELAEKFETKIANFSKEKMFCDSLASIIETKRNQQNMIKSQIKNEESLKKKLLELNKELATMTELNEKLTQEVLKTQEAIRFSKKPLKAAIKKHSEYFGMDVKVKENLSNKFTATVTLSGNMKAASINVQIDKATLEILNVDYAALPRTIAEKLEKESFPEDPNVWLAKLWNMLESEYPLDNHD